MNISTTKKMLPRAIIVVKLKKKERCLDNIRLFDEKKLPVERQAKASYRISTHNITNTQLDDIDISPSNEQIIPP